LLLLILNLNNNIKLTKHIGIKANAYKAYLKCGSIASPLTLMRDTILNWIFWYAVFYLIGGYNLAITIFGITCFWALGVRTFNYKGHGKGKDKRREGIDYNRTDLSVNQLWPGFIAGEWHNNPTYILPVQGLVFYPTRSILPGIILKP